MPNFINIASSSFANLTGLNIVGVSAALATLPPTIMGTIAYTAQQLIPWAVLAMVAGAVIGLAIFFLWLPFDRNKHL